MKRFKGLFALAVATSLSGFAFAPTANAVVSVDNDVLGAISFNDQTSLSPLPQGLKSFSGADLSVLFSFEGDTDANTGVFSALVENKSSVASDAIMTAIGINIVDDVFTQTGFTFTSINCAGTCAFSDNGTGLSGFLSDINLSAGADSSPTKNGLGVGDIGRFDWAVSFADGAIDGLGVGVNDLDNFFDFFESEFVDNTLLFDGSDGTDVNAFWVAHMQSVDTFDIDTPTCVDPDTPACDGSLKIGGATNTGLIDVSEPGMLALFGVGALAIGIAARRRRKHS